MSNQRGKAKPKNAKRNTGRPSQRRPPRANNRSMGNKNEKLDILDSNKLSVAPTAKSRRFVNQPARFQYAPNGDITVYHREYVTDVAGSVAFTVTSIPINPGLSQICPWLAPIAQRYESYIFEKVNICYETESASTATGTLMVAIDFDSSDAAPNSKSEMMTYRNAARSAPWTECIYSAAKEDLSKLKSHYVRAGNLAANQDIKMYDLGNLYIATIGQAGTTTIGEIYIEYVVRFSTPQILPSSAQSLFLNIASGLSQGNMFGTSLVASAGILPYTINSASTITFNSQCELLVSVAIVGSVLSGAMTNTGTCTFTAGVAIYNSAATQGQVTCILRASPGQTFIPAQVATTMTATVWTFASYSYANGAP